KVHDLVKVAVARKAVYLLCLTAHRHYLDLAGPVHHAHFRDVAVKHAPSKRAVYLVRDENYLVLGVRGQLLKVLNRGAALKHAGGRHYYCRVLVVEDLLALAAG